MDMVWKLAKNQRSAKRALGDFGSGITSDSLFGRREVTDGAVRRGDLPEAHFAAWNRLACAGRDFGVAAERNRDFLLGRAAEIKDRAVMVVDRPQFRVIGESACSGEESGRDRREGEFGDGFHRVTF